MKNTNADKMITSVLSQLNVSAKDVCELSIVREGEYYHVNCSTDLVAYEIYADAESYEIMGLDTQPVPEEVLVAESLCGALAA